MKDDTPPRLDTPYIGKTTGDRLRDFPWWLAALIALLILGYVLVFTDPDYSEALQFIIPGLRFTVIITLVSYAIALVIGLLAGLGRISRSTALNNIATFYVETVRGIPILVFIFFIAFVGTPTFVEGVINGIGQLLVDIGLGVIGGPLVALENNDIPQEARAIAALSIAYGAFLAEIFRAGIQSVSKGQMEAARSLGMSYPQAMRHVILPQAVRNVLPALGNDFVAMVKDSSLVSVLAIRDITQRSRLYAGRTFRFEEAYVTLTILYLTLVIILSLAVSQMERRLGQDE